MLFQRICPGCRRERVRTLLCRACAEALPDSVIGAVDPPPGIDRLRALHPYGPGVARLVLAAKNGDRRDLLAHWAQGLAGLVEGESIGSPVVTWVPASRAGARRRGYDQGRILARGLAAAAGVEARRLLVRRPEPGQAGADRATRMRGPSLRSAVRCPPRVVLVDDVVTTGASLSAAASVLRRAGAEEILAVTVAVAGDRARLGSIGPDRSGEILHYC